MRRLAPLAAAGLTLLSSAAFAAGEKEGMPQLAFGNPLTISQIVWLVVIFFALYQLLANWALPKVAGVLEARAAAIASDLEAARKAKAESDAAVAAVNEASRLARAEAQAEINTAIEAAKRNASAQAAQLDERLNAMLAAAEAQIAVARKAAMGALREVASDTATVVVTRLTGRPPSAVALDAAVESALAARSRG